MRSPLPSEHRAPAASQGSVPVPGEAAEGEGGQGGAGAGNRSGETSRGPGVLSAGAPVPGWGWAGVPRCHLSPSCPRPQKADRAALAGKVSCAQFDAAVEQLSKMIEDTLSKVTGQEQGWHRVQQKLVEELGSKVQPGPAPLPSPLPCSTPRAPRRAGAPLQALVAPVAPVLCQLVVAARSGRGCATPSWTAWSWHRCGSSWRSAAGASWGSSRRGHRRQRPTMPPGLGSERLGDSWGQLGTAGDAQVTRSKHSQVSLRILPPCPGPCPLGLFHPSPCNKDPKIRASPTSGAQGVPVAPRALNQLPAVWGCPWGMRCSPNKASEGFFWGR